MSHEGIPRFVVEVSYGELLDKLTILELKAERIADEEKLHHVRAELAHLRDVAGAPTSEIAALTDMLRAVNAALWDVEDELRRCEAAQEFDGRFVAHARAVYLLNDERAALKRSINTLSGSRFVEEKSYAPAAPHGPHGSH